MKELIRTQKNNCQELVKGCMKQIGGKVVETGAEDVTYKIFDSHPEGETDRDSTLA